MNTLFIPVLLGTAREGRLSEHVARFVADELARIPGVETQLVDVRDFLFGKTIRYDKARETEADPWKKIMARADGLFIVSPEYNHSFPGELKVLLDSTFDEYGRKPAALCGVSSGGLSGARAVDSLKQVVIGLKMAPIRNSLFVSEVQKLFAPKDGAPMQMDPAQVAMYQERLKLVTDEFLWMARALKIARGK